MMKYQVTAPPPSFKTRVPHDQDETSFEELYQDFLMTEDDPGIVVGTQKDRPDLLNFIVDAAISGNLKIGHASKLLTKYTECEHVICTFSLGEQIEGTIEAQERSEIRKLREYLLGTQVRIRAIVRKIHSDNLSNDPTGLPSKFMSLVNNENARRKRVD